MCKVLKIARASYYKWLNRKETKEELENHEIAQLIQDYDERFNHILGYRRMTRWINKFNHKKYSKGRIRRIMMMLGIKSIIRKKKPKYGKSTAEAVAENLLKRDFNASKPNEKWATDVTEFKIIGSKQKHYLSAIIDLYDRSIVAYIISKRNDNNLVFRTFEKAMEKNPGATPLFHSDRGFQYTSKAFKHMLEKSCITQSMSRVGRCIDNGPIEGFWGIIKAEMYYLHKFHTENEIIQSIDEYIEFYNNVRPQGRYQDQTPNEVRETALRTNSEIKQYPIEENKRIQKYYQALEAKQASCVMA